ncbi:hypothetical protein YC2023_047649 [Brassica napus]
MVKEAHEKLKGHSSIYRHLAVLKVLPLPFLGNRDGWIHGNRVKENNSQRLMGVPALDASFENPLARYQNLPYNPLLTQANPSNAGLVSVEGHLRNPLQNQEIGSFPLQKWPVDSHGTDLALHENFETFSSLIDGQNQQQPTGSSFQAPFSWTWTSRLSLSTVSIILGIDVLLAVTSKHATCEEFRNIFEMTTQSMACTIYDYRQIFIMKMMVSKLSVVPTSTCLAGGSLQLN